MSMKFRARAPVRIDFLGGGTDCPPFSAEHGGAVVNAGISRYVYATVELGGEGVRLVSKDFDVSVEAADVDALPIDGKLDLLKACVKRGDIKTGFTLTTESDLPPESGLGASGAVSVAVFAAMYHAAGKPVDPREVAHLSFVVERKDLGYPGGSQDQYGAAFGGVNYLTFKDPDVGVEQLAGRYASPAHPRVHAPTLLELEKNSLLVYTGVSHVSGNIHADIRASYDLADSPTKRAMHNLKRLADEGRDALLRGDLRTFAELLNGNWKWHKELHESCTNEKLEAVYSLALQNGALGGKTCGAGGGGCVVFICEDGAKPKLCKLLEAEGCQTLDFVLDFNGVQVWAV
jgi:D-glycero-alpha-D-manno-heptose-7-phosphate kinase